jgi:diguanylate cyclase (GGDEF)-like protein/putative nucleotidyltransferase with HDIG domain
MLFAVVLVATAIGIAVVQRSNHQVDLDSQLRTAARQQATVLGDYFERARTAIQVTAQNPDFEAFYDAPGRRAEKVFGQIPALRRASDALAFLGTLYGDAIGSADFIDKTGVELARVVGGEASPPGELSPDRSGTAFFRPTLELIPGGVYQSKPYISQATHRWVISNSTMIPSGRGMVHFEVALESFRSSAATAAGEDIAIQVIEGDSGSAVMDSRRTQWALEQMTPVADPSDPDWVRDAGVEGSLESTEGQAAFARLPAADGNANDWLVVALSEHDAGLVDGIGPGTMTLFVTAIVLFLTGALGYRSTQAELTRAALSDSLTGLGNRRKLLSDLEARDAAAGSGYALAMFDLDGFKTYNDTFGHPAGDALLERLSRKLALVAGDRACAYRLGGDEFCLLVDQTGSARAELVNAALAALSEHGNGFSITSSHGSVERDDAESADEMLHLADKRMYAEKHGRRLTADTQSRDVLLRALEERYPELLPHREDLADLAEAIARRLGLDDNDVLLVRRAAELHDIGKVAIPDSILRKAEALNDDEWTFMRRHSEIGQRILDVAPSLASVGKLIRAHHERYDGSGYPDALAGDDIPVGARVVSVVDAYHAMIVEDRPHKPRLTHAAALAEIRRHAGTQFDPAVVEAFAAMAGASTSAAV